MPQVLLVDGNGVLHPRGDPAAQRPCGGLWEGGTSQGACAPSQPGDLHPGCWNLGPEEHRGGRAVFTSDSSLGVLGVRSRGSQRDWRPWVSQPHCTGSLWVQSGSPDTPLWPPAQDQRASPEPGPLVLRSWPPGRSPRVLGGVGQRHKGLAAATKGKGRWQCPVVKTGLSEVS